MTVSVTTTLTGQSADRIGMIAQATYAAGAPVQGRNGRAMVYDGSSSIAQPNTARFQERDQMSYPINPAIAILDGGPVYYDRSNFYATYLRTGANRSYFVGTSIGDNPVGSANVNVDLNIEPKYEIELARTPFTAGSNGTFAAAPPGGLFRYGGGHLFTLDATSEAQRKSLLSDDGIITGSKGIIRGAFVVRTGGAAANAKFYIGVASADQATDPTANGNYIYLEIDSNNTAVNALSYDGTLTTAKTSVASAYTVGTRYEFWIDMRNPASVKLYCQGVQVLSSTTFAVSTSSTQNYFLHAWLGKTASTDTMSVEVCWLNAQTAEQSIAGV